MSDDSNQYMPVIPDHQEGVLIFNEKKYAVGLTWLTTDGDPSQKLIQERAQKLKADYYCLRTSMVNQQGYGKIEMGHRASMLSAASVAADSLVGEWHGIFAADNGWWYLGVFADAIAPDGDRLFFSEEEAYNFFITRSAEHKWPRSYAPVAWNLPDVTGEIPVEQLLREAQIASPLRALSMDAFFGGRKRRNIAIFAFCVFAFFALSIAIIPLFLSGSYKEHMGVTLVVRTDAPEVIKPPPPPPVEDASMPTDTAIMRSFVPSSVITTCTKTFESLIHPLPGWHLQTARCNGTTSRANWRRQSGSLDLLQEAVGLFPEDVRPFLSGSDAFEASISVPTRDIDMYNAQMLPRDTAIIIVNARFDRVGVMALRHVVSSPQRQVVAQRPGGLSASPPSAPPEYLEMKLETSILPSVLAPYFDIPGLRIQNIEWNVQSGKWYYESHIFIKSGGS